MPTVSEARLLAESPEALLEFETLLADISTRFINLTPGEVDLGIEGALRQVCELLGIDTAVLWRWSDESPGVILPTHFYYAHEGMQPPERMSQELFPWFAKRMLAGHQVAIASLDELPAEATVDRESGRLLGIRSNLTLPLLVGGQSPIGALAFNTLQEERHWPDALVNRLQLIAQIFTNALVRRRADLALSESEQIGRATFDQAAVGMAHVGTDGRWLRVNDKLCAIVGYPREELLQSTFREITHPDDLDSDLELVRRVLSSELKTFSVEKRCIRKDRSLVWVNLTVSLMRNAAGKPRHFISVVEDITDRKRNEELLRANESRLEASAKLAGLAFYEVDLGEGTVLIDDRFRDLCGVPPERERGLGALEFWLDHLHPDDREQVLELRQQLHEGRLEQISAEYRYLHPAQGCRWIQHEARVALRDATGRAINAFGVLCDITKEKLAENEMRELSRRLIRAHEEERALLARELHDDVTQRLAVLAIEIGRVAPVAADLALEKTMREVGEELMRLSEDIHSLAYHLHPSVLHELGLADALRAECDRRVRQGQLELSVDLCPLPAALAKEAALCLFRVAQESLNNVARHAGVPAASITLRQIDAGLLLAVRDQGIGFDPEHSRERTHLGLASMRERVWLVNGTLDIESGPGQGTTVIAWVPTAGVAP